MTPETARQTIEKYLELGTLQGVRVEYEGGEVMYFIQSPLDKIYVGETFTFYDENRPVPSSECYSLPSDGYYENIKSIHPIPLQPKLLEVGTRVKIIGGEHEGKVGEILIAEDRGYKIWVEYKENDWIDCWDVIPESLLVEEEESEVMSAVASVNRNIQVGAATIKALKQAGYKITKE